MPKKTGEDHENFRGILSGFGKTALKRALPVPNYKWAIQQPTNPIIEELLKKYNGDMEKVKNHIRFTRPASKSKRKRKQFRSIEEPFEPSMQ